MGSFWAGQEQDILNYNLTPVIYRLDLAEKFNQAAKERGVIADVHIKIDTGMNRIGVRFDEIRHFVENLKKLENIKVDGLMTHFAAADTSVEFTSLQIRRFNETIEIFHENGFRPAYKDLANSPGTLGYKEAHGNMVRLGGVLYGLWWDILPKNINPPVLKPVMTVHSRIVLLKRVPKGETIGYGGTYLAERDLLIATVPIGYQDGYRRGLSNLGQAIINGVYVPVAGRISMDWTTFDVTDVPNVKVGDAVVLIGEQNDLRVTAEEIAEKTGTVSYEITCGINRRVNRFYI
jgi:alanine racemase